MYESLKNSAAFIFTEVLIVFSLVFVINNYIGNVAVTIKSDGIGYYDYLPSLFIHHDLVRKDHPKDIAPDVYKRLEDTQVYNEYNGYMVNKYPCGPAILELPFFVKTWVSLPRSNLPSDGYQPAYHRSIFHAALVYLFLSLVFLRKLLLTYSINRWIIAALQVFLVLGTSVTNYVNFDASYSHIFSLFAITSFLYFSRVFFQHKSLKHFLFASLMLGLIFTLRNPNILILLFLPFIAGSWQQFLTGISFLFKNIKMTLLGVLLFFCIASIQLILWYLQTGDFLVYTYQGEGFNFLTPHFYDVLFSYRKGLFVYQPILFLMLVGLVWLFLRRQFYLLLTWTFFFIAITYFISSWWAWSYGASFGQRVYIDYYPIFFIPFALMLNHSRMWIKLGVLTLAVVLIPVNIIQTLQYKEYILHWESMDKENYWKVFLKTESKYVGLIWKKKYDVPVAYQPPEFRFGDVLFNGVGSAQIRFQSDQLSPLKFLDNIRIELRDQFNPKENSFVQVEVVQSNGQAAVWQSTPLIHFHEEGLNTNHMGVYDFMFDPIPLNKDSKVIIEFWSELSPKTFQAVKVSFFGRDE